MKRGLSVSIAVALGVLAAAVPAGAALKVAWMPGFKAPGTPARYDKVGVIKVGSPRAKNVLVLEPGTLAGGSYFVPLAKWIVAKVKGWQVWSVERRENLLEDQSELNLAKEGKATTRQLFDYYVGFIKDHSVKHHIQFIPDSHVPFAKQWGMRVAVEDLHRVIAAASKLGGKVMLGGHSLGGTVVTAYATWNFHGRPGAAGLGGLVYIDGASRSAVSAATATDYLRTLDASNTSPWLAIAGLPAPLAGVFNAFGSTASLIAPGEPSLAQGSGLLPADIVPPVRVTSIAQYGYAANVPTSPQALGLFQAHLGKGIAARGPIHGWDGRGALTPITRYATMYSGAGIRNIDGTEWYFPLRLTIDTQAVGNGIANPSQRVLGVNATMGRRLPRHLLIYAFAASLGGRRVLDAARALAEQSRIPGRNLMLVDRHTTYAHNDPAGAYPRNVFFSHLIAFLQKVAGR